MSKIPQTEEYLEAAQQETDRHRNEFIESLSPEDQNKFKVVEQAINLLQDNDIPFWLFPVLPFYENPTVSICWQYNGLGKIEIFGKDGKLTDEALERLQVRNATMLSSIYGFFANSFGTNNSDEKFSMFGRLVNDALNYVHKHILGSKNEAED